MSPGEELIYNYIISENSYYACKVIKAKLTRLILNAYHEIEVKRMKEAEIDILGPINEKLESFPLIKLIDLRCIFWSIHNEIWNCLRSQTETQEAWHPDPLNGKFITITYGEIQEKLGISKDVAKSCIDRLIERGKLKKKRGIGGLQYSPDTLDLMRFMRKNPGEWKPQKFCSSTGYRDDESEKMYYIMEHAQKNFNNFQDTYEETIREGLKLPLS